MGASNWRKESQRVIYEILNANREASQEEVRNLIQGAYPFGERAFHPYRIWREEALNALNFRSRLMKNNAEVADDTK